MFANQALLWDIQVEDLDPVLHKHWLIERVAQAGVHLQNYDLWRGIRIASLDGLIAMKLNLSRSPPLRLRRSYDWEDIKRFFTVHVTKYLRDLK